MSKKSKTDLLVRQRFQNPLPAPSFPPKLLTIKTDPARYATYDFLVPLAMERAVPMVVDQEAGMHFDPNRVPGYWEDIANQGRSSSMVADTSVKEMVPLDDEDRELIVDLPGITPASAGLIPHSSSGANLDAIGSGSKAGSGTSTPLSALDRRKRDVAFVKRADYAVASEIGNMAKREAMQQQLAAQQAAAQSAEQTVEQQIETITATFSSLRATPLNELKHPAKAHLQAVEAFDILPDDPIWANQYATFKFADNPVEDRRLGAASADGSSSSAPSSNFALFRPLDPELAENRVAFFLPDDEDVAQAYNTKRRQEKDVDTVLAELVKKGQDVFNDPDAPMEAPREDGDEEETYGFKFIRDYDAIRREVKSEFIFMISEGDETSEGREKGAYYIPLTGHTLLRKRRARKGEVANDYSDIGQEFWGGVLVSVAGKEVLPEDEIEGRRDELLPIIGPRTEAEETNTAAHGDDVNGNDEAAGKAENEVAAAAAAA